MNTLSHPIRSNRFPGILVLAALLWSLALSASWAKGDALQEASTPSLLAPKSLLLDLVLVGQRLIAVGERGHILISKDNGNNWTQANVPVRVTLTASYFLNDTLGWAVGHDGVVLRTQDGGLNWNLLLDGNQVNDLVIEHALQRVADLETALDDADQSSYTENQEGEDGNLEEKRQALEISLEEAQIAAEDAEAFKEEGPSRPFLDAWFKNANEGIIVGAFGLILHTRNGGESWTPMSDRIDNPNGFHLNAIRQIGDTLFITAEAGTIYRSDDGGDSWETLDSPYHGSFFGIAGDGKGRVIVYGLRGHAFQSDDWGNNWTEINTGISASLYGGTMLRDGRMVMVGAGGLTILTDTDGQVIRTLQTAARLPLSSVLEGSDGRLLMVGAAGLQTADVSTNPAQTENDQ